MRHAPLVAAKAFGIALQTLFDISRDVVEAGFRLADPDLATGVVIGVVFMSLVEPSMEVAFWIVAALTLWATVARQ